VETENFTFEEQTSYTGIIIELDSTENPLEIGAFVNDTCIGASVVNPDDSLCHLQAYTEGTSGEITFQEYYGPNKSDAVERKEYLVLNQKTFIREKRALDARENYPIQFVSFKSGKQTVEIEYEAFMNCYPNPFNRSCNIEIVNPNEGQLRLEVIDIYGKVVHSLFNGNKEPGAYNFNWTLDNKGIPDGIYFIRMQTEQNVITKKVVYAF